ncbi:hypothetical protein [Xenorhabdus cabanillasii]|uniref:hypothetical protein n=2 Tax=Xenorhabdus cabanillasii TaxID=351673 RepID=UPI0004AD6C0E|nr:hypothetical protein [Xenorhabdus cabanillasii]
MMPFNPQLSAGSYQSHRFFRHQRQSASVLCCRSHVRTGSFLAGDSASQYEDDFL